MVLNPGGVVQRPEPRGSSDTLAWSRVCFLRFARNPWIQNGFDAPAVKFGAFWRCNWVPYHRDADDMARDGSLLATPQGRFDRAGRRYPGMCRVFRSDGSPSDMASCALARDASKTIAARELRADNPETGTVAIEGSDEAQAGLKRDWIDEESYRTTLRAVDRI